MALVLLCASHGAVDFTARSEAIAFNGLILILVFQMIMDITIDAQTINFYHNKDDIVILIMKISGESENLLGLHIDLKN